MSFDKKLQSLRKKAGISQEELANQLGVSRQAVSKWESGISYPEMDKLILMTRLFKCSMDDLVNDEIKNVSVDKKTSKGQTYIDSLLEFITKTLDMFNSMKFTSIIKCLAELVIFTIVIAGILALMYAIVSEVLYGIFGYNTFLDWLYSFLASFLFICTFALGAVIVFQFFKIRYLDYYDKLVYKYDVKNKKENVEDAKDEENKEVDDNTKKERLSEAKKTKERIVIRDPHHKPLAFLSAISSIVLFCYKVMVRLITIPFLFAFVFMMIGLVILLYLITYNVLFVGVVISLIAAIVVDILFIYTLSSDLFKHEYPTKIMAIIFLGSLAVFGIGVGATITSFDKIDFKTIDGVKHEERIVPFNDKLYLNLFNGLEDDRLEFIVDDTRDDVLIDITYDYRYSSYTLESAAGNPNYMLLTVNYNNDYNPKVEIDELLSNLKKNKIYLKDYGMHYFNVTVTANEKQIKSLINTISEYAEVYTYVENSNGRKYYYLKETLFYNNDDKICVTDDYYRKCIKLIDNTRDDAFNYEYKNNKLIYDNNKYYCYVQNNGYVCEKRRTTNMIE